MYTGYTKSYTLTIHFFHHLPSRKPQRAPGTKWWKLNKGAALAEEILTKAGVDRDRLPKTSVVASHPGGTVRIGELLDKDCYYYLRCTVDLEPF